MEGDTISVEYERHEQSITVQRYNAIKNISERTLQEKAKYDDGSAISKTVT